MDSPIIRLASAMVTIPVPRLISQDFWYCANTPPDNAVIALATQRPTVIVKDGLMLEAFTMSALSPVARMERPNLVFKNADKITPITSTINAATISLYQPPPMAFFASLNMVFQLNMFTF